MQSYIITYEHERVFIYYVTPKSTFLMHTHSLTLTLTHTHTHTRAQHIYTHNTDSQQTLAHPQICSRTLS